MFLKKYKNIKTEENSSKSISFDEFNKDHIEEKEKPKEKTKEEILEENFDEYFNEYMIVFDILIYSLKNDTAFIPNYGDLEFNKNRDYTEIMIGNSSSSFYINLDLDKNNTVLIFNQYYYHFNDHKFLRQYYKMHRLTNIEKQYLKDLMVTKYDYILEDKLFEIKKLIHQMNINKAKIIFKNITNKF